MIMRSLKPDMWRFGGRKAALGVLACGLFLWTVSPVCAEVPITDSGQLTTNTFDTLKKEAYWAMEEIKNAEIITDLTDTYDTITDVTGDFLDNVWDVGALEVAHERMETDAKVKAEEALINAKTANTFAAAKASIVGQNVSTSSDQLCRAVYVSQLVTTTQDFAREISRAIVEGISNRSRYHGSNEPLEVVRALIAECGGDLKFGGKLDGTNACYNDDTLKTVGTDGRPLSYTSLIGPDGSQVYEMTKISTTSYKDPVTGQTMVVRYPSAPINDDQKFWVGIFQWVYNAVGHRPIPVTLRSPAGISQRAMYNHCLANYNTLVKQCADLVAFYTRPNSEDTGLATLREFQNKLCQKAEKNLNMDRFGNCKMGLSAYEAHMVELAMCQSSNYMMGMKYNGATDPEGQRLIDQCSKARLSFDSLVTKMHRNCQEAIDTMPRLDGCWDSVRALGGEKLTNDRSE